MVDNNTNESVPVHGKSSGNDITWIVMATSWTALGLLSAALNLLVCYAVYKIKKLRTVTNCFVVSLSTADLLVAMLLTPMHIIGHYAKTVVNGYLIAFILLASIFNLAAVTFERYIALTRPFQYRSLFSSRRIGIILSVAWVSPLVISLLPLAWDTNPNSVCHKIYLVVLVGVFILLPIVVMICIYTRLLGVVRSFILRNRSRASIGNATGTRVGREEKAARVFAFVFSTFLICWGPIIYINICLVAEARGFLSDELLFVSFYTLQINSIVDPVIYAFFKRDFIRARNQRANCLCCGEPKSDDLSSEMVLQRASSNRQSALSRSANHANKQR
jgi:hypothetical protein